MVQQSDVTDGGDHWDTTYAEVTIRVGFKGDLKSLNSSDGVVAHFGLPLEPTTGEDDGALRDALVSASYSNTGDDDLAVLFAAAPCLAQMAELTLRAAENMKQRRESGARIIPFPFPDDDE